MKLRALILIALTLLGGAAPGVVAAQTTPATATEVAGEPSAAQLRCEALFGGRFNGLPSAPTQITNATWHDQTPQRRAYCAVEGYVNPTIKFGMYLPGADWNQKFLLRGCGGSCGTVEVERICRSHLRDGYACIHTDMGHFSTLSDNNWVANNLQGNVDFGYRATHVVTLAGKAITEAYYSRAPKLSYYMGCSTGGRQGLVEVQRYPEDFDGVIVIAAAAGTAGMAQLPRLDMATFNTGPDGRMILPPRKVYTVQRAVMEQCDKLDGLKDNLINNPPACKFDPARIQCKAGVDSQRCLTEPQVAVVRKIYAAGAWPGAEADWMDKYIRLPLTPEQIAARGTANRGDPSVNGPLGFAGNPDLRAFKARGGKLLTAFGWNDPQIDPRGLIDYYELTTNTMGGPDKTRDFFRLFLIPGMEHCSTGDGAFGVNYIGELERWVEGGVAPDKIVGVHPKPGTLDFFNVDLPFLDKSNIEFSRPHFAYPKSAYYSGKGDPTKAESFVGK